MIEGIVYAEKKVIFETGAVGDVHGHVMSERDKIELGIAAYVQFHDWEEARDNPPPAFAIEGEPELHAGSWQRDLR